MLAPQAILADRVTFRLRSLDRLLLNLYQPLLQTPEQLRAFLCGVRRQPIVSPALFGQIGRDFIARVERFAANQGIEIVAFPRGADKEDLADAYFARTPKRHGVIFIGVAQERARSWWGAVRRTERGLDCAFARRTVAVKHSSGGAWVIKSRNADCAGCYRTTAASHPSYSPLEASARFSSR